MKSPTPIKPDNALGGLADCLRDLVVMQKDLAAAHSRIATFYLEHADQLKVAAELIDAVATGERPEPERDPRVRRIAAIERGGPAA